MNAPNCSTVGFRLRDAITLLALLGGLAAVFAYDRFESRISAPIAGEPEHGLLDLTSDHPEGKPDTGQDAEQSSTSPDSVEGQPGRLIRQPQDQAEGEKPQKVEAPSEDEQPQPKRAATSGQHDGKLAQEGIDRLLKTLAPEPVEAAKPKLTSIVAMPERNQFDKVVDGFIQYDIGRLRGEKGNKARNDFNRLGTESIPALIRGLNKAASISASCPVIALARKLSTMLASSGSDMVELAINHIGRGVPSNARHRRHLESLKGELLRRLPQSHPLRRRLDLANSLVRDVSNISQYVKSEDPNERWAAARAIANSRAPLGDELIQLLGDPEPTIVQEARTALQSLARGEDFGPTEGADANEKEEAVATWRRWWARQSPNSVFSQVARQTDEQLIETLGSTDPEERWAAVVAMGNRRVPCYRQLIGLLRDEDRLVRRDAKDALVRLADGLDFGPADDHDAEATDLAVTKWTRWVRLQDLLTQYLEMVPDAVVSAFENQNALERLAAVRASRQRQLNCPDKLIPMLRDDEPEICQEARHALIGIANGSDFGPSEHAGPEAVDVAVERWENWLRWHNLVISYGRKSQEEIVRGLQSEDPLERWAAIAVTRRKRLKVADHLIPLLRDDNSDVQQEARQALVELAGGEHDFGPNTDATPSAIDESIAGWGKWWAREQLLVSYLSMPSEDLAERLRAPDIPERWAAVTAARRQRAGLIEDLIPLVQDRDADVRQEARRALVQWAKNEDFGPSANASEPECQSAAQDWSAWWSREKQQREMIAGNQYRMAEMIINKNSPAARERLRAVIREFPGTEAARDAQKLLEQDALLNDGELAGMGPGERETPKRQALSPEQLEREARKFMVLSIRLNRGSPQAVKKRLLEGISRYPGTVAAREAQELIDMGVLDSK